MTTTPDTGNGGTFDPHQAAELLAQTTKSARRKFEPYPPLPWVIRGVGVLAIYCAIWFSVRGQHPYRGPTVAVLPVVYIFVFINFVATVFIARRANAGVSGKSRLRPAEVAVMVVVWVGVFVPTGVMAGDHVGRTVVYGLYPATVPLMVAGVAWAAIMALRANWRRCVVALVVAAVGAVGLLGGPIGSWLIAGSGLFVVCLANAIAIARRQRD